MDVNAISTLLSNNAFPIVAFLLLFWFIKDEQAKNRDQIERLGEVISENTKVIATLLEHFHKEVK